MDRLETTETLLVGELWKKFTFQYGQIRNFLSHSASYGVNGIYIPVWIDQKHIRVIRINEKKKIYIPVWIDQKRTNATATKRVRLYLHSSMDRLETNLLFAMTFKAKMIYIPVWIDQKHIKHILLMLILFYLHSSMDRLETQTCTSASIRYKRFTFQYGQIRNTAGYTAKKLEWKTLYSSMDRLETIISRGIL